MVNSKVISQDLHNEIKALQKRKDDLEEELKQVIFNILSQSIVDVLNSIFRLGYRFLILGCDDSRYSNSVLKIP